MTRTTFNDVMRTLFDERFAPITSEAGYLRVPLDRAVDALVGWRRQLNRSVEITERSGLSEGLLSLQPLTSHEVPRELLVEVTSGWTAYFNCALRGTDAAGAVGYLAMVLACSGLCIEAIPHTARAPKGNSGRLGSVQFQLFGPSKTEFLNYVRTIALTHDGRGWKFESWGTPLGFEEINRYAGQRPRERFTSAVLERYCKALGVDAFNEAAYGPRAVLVSSQIGLPPDAIVKSLQQTQAWLDIVPGASVELPG